MSLAYETANAIDNTGVMLKRSGPVHAWEAAGRKIVCGEPVDHSPTTPVTAAQVMAHRLQVCPKCFPQNTSGRRRGRPPGRHTAAAVAARGVITAIIPWSDQDEL